jgi:hypothetical protein
MRGCLPLAAILLLATAPALAHGVETRVLTQGAVTAEFRFTDGTVMADADALAFAPGKPDRPALTGRTDAEGRFSLFPDRDGDWAVEVHDAEGHVARTVISVAGGRVAATKHAFPDWLVAISLVANVVAAGLIGRRRPKLGPLPAPAEATS